MHKIYFYRNRRGEQPVLDYLRELSGRSDKDSRIKANKIRDYVKALSQYGLSLGEPRLKYLGNGLWELRPLRDRILFVAWIDDSFVLLHHFMKKTQKTPAREIETARRALEDIQERGVDHE